MSSVTISEKFNKILDGVVPDHKILYSSFLILSVVLAALSLIPELDLVGAITLRSVSLLSCSTLAVTHWSQDNIKEKFSKFARIGAVALGLIGVAAGIPLLSTISLGVVTAISGLDLLEAIRKRDKEKALMSLGLLLINALGLGAMISGSWEVLATAAAVNGVAFSLLAAKTVIQAKDMSDLSDALCYAAFSILGTLGATRAPQLKRPHFDRLPIGSAAIIA